MICFIIVGASFLSVAMGYLKLPANVARVIGEWGLSPYMLIIALTIFYAILGCFLDGISMIVMTLPICLPLVLQTGFSSVWFGVYMTIVIEMGQITPPVGFNLFVIQALTDEPIEKVASAAFPFFILIVLMVASITIFPEIVTWLPSKMVR